MTPQTEPSPTARRQEGTWAEPVTKLKVSSVPSGAVNLNVEGRQVVSPMQGFGQMWQKTYWLPLRGANMTPPQVVQEWKEKFPQFLPAHTRFYPPLHGVQPGEVVFISDAVGGVPVRSGVMVLYSDDECFTVMTPEGFPESGWNTFGAYEDNGCTVIQIQSLIRTSDPIYEAGYRIVGARAQEGIWKETLENLARHFGVTGQTQMQKVLMDPKCQWSQVGNVWKNAMIRTMIYQVGAPLRWIRNRAKA